MDLLPVLKIQRLLPRSQLTLPQPGICRELHAPKATSLSLKPPARAEPFCLCGAGLEGLTLRQDTQHQTHSTGGPRWRRVGPAPHCSQTLSVPCQVIHTMTTHRPWLELWENVSQVLHNGQDVEVGHWKSLQVLGLKQRGYIFPTLMHTVAEWPRLWHLWDGMSCCRSLASITLPFLLPE